MSSSTTIAASDAKEAEIVDRNEADNVISEKDQSEAVQERKFERIKKVKVVLMLSYCGQGYYGMQRNIGLQTIEGELFQALFENKYIDQTEVDRPQIFQFQRAARTDKNVSAARQIVSFKAPHDIDATKLNAVLPPCIRVMKIKRVTRSFDCKLSCDARTYSYMMPTFAFAPMETLLTESYRITPDVLETARKLFNMYLGTKNFHNFTARKRSQDPSAKRHIISFTVGEPFEKDGLEYVVLRVKGQSFMLHQIRKMIGLCTAILRGFAHENVFEKAFGHEKIDVPKAPGVGLMLEEVHYHRYDRRYGSDGIHETLTWDEVKDEVERFCDEKIYPIVTKTENEEKSMWNWLATLVFHTYDVREHEDGDRNSEIAKAYFNAGLGRKLAKDEDDEEDGEDDEDNASTQQKRHKLS